MATEIILPRVDMDMATGKVIAWHAEDGARVEKGQLLFDIETDKAAMEIEAPASGVLRIVDARIGVDVPVGNTIGWIGAADEVPSAPAKPVPAANSDAGLRAAALQMLPAERVTAEDGVKTPRATPCARRLAKQHGIDLATVIGTGPRRRVQSDDVRKVIEQTPATTPTTAAAPTAPATQRAVAPGGLHRVWLRQGNGAPSVLIHGFGAELSSWRPLLTASGDVGPVLAIDLPGHGKSPMTEGADLPALVGAVEETLAEENVASLHLLGHSLGGAVATLLATRGAVEVRSLLLLDPAGLGPEINGAFIAGFLRAESEASLVPWLRELVSKEANLPQGLAAATLRQRRDGRLVAAQARIAATVLPDGTQAFSTRALFETLSIPAKIVFGTDDRIIPARHALGLPGTVALHLFPGTGHTPQLERRSEVARLWVELLRAAG